MLVPISKVMKTSKVREGILFYNTETEKTEYLKLRNIYEHRNPSLFTGLSCEDRTVRLHKLFKGIGVLGEDVSNEEVFVVCQKIIGMFGTDYLIVNKIGKSQRVSKEDMLQLIKSGIKIAGVALIENDKLIVASDIELIVMKEDVVVDA